MPEIAYLTDEPGTNNFARKARALARGFAEIGVSFDAVYIKRLDGIRVDGQNREVGLGDHRAVLSAPALTRYLREAQPRLALVNSGQMGPAALVAGRRAGVTVVPWEPTFLDRELRSLPRRMRLMPLVQRPIYRRAAAIAAPSREMVEWVSRYRRVPAERVHLLPNPVDGDFIRSEAAGITPDEAGPFRIVAVGRLVEQKGYDILIAALGAVATDLPAGWELEIVGEAGVWRGGWAERITALAAEAGIAGHVKLAGYRDNPHAEMARAHLFAHAARWEAFGNVLVEALALGLPIVATDCPGGPREILDGGRYGRLVPPANPAALGRAIAELANDPVARAELGAAGPERARAWEPRPIAERILEIEELVTAQRP